MEKTFILTQGTQLVGLDGKALKPNGSDGAKLQLSNAFTSVKNVTAACFAIQQTPFNPITPKPEWYEDVNEKFLAVKSLADIWVKDYAVAITSTIPSTVMTFTPRFTSCSDVIKTIIQNSGFEPDETDINTISNILRKMLDNVGSIQTNVSKYCRIVDGKSQGLLIDWQKNMSQASNELKIGTNTVQKASQDLASEIQELTSSIENYKKEIAYYNKLVATGAGMVGGGAFLGVVGGAICLACPIAGGIVLFLGIGSVIAGATIWGVYQEKINSAYREIQKNTNLITSKNKTLLEINTLAQSTNSAVDYADLAVRNLSDFSTAWTVMGNSILDTLQDLNSADEEVREDAIKALISLTSAGKQWETVKSFAESLLSLNSNVSLVDVASVNMV